MKLLTAIVLGTMTGSAAFAAESFDLGEKELLFTTYSEGNSTQEEATLQVKKIKELEGSVEFINPKVKVGDREYFLRGSNNNKDVIDFFCNTYQDGYVADSYTVIGLIHGGVLTAFGKEVNQQVVGSVSEDGNTLETYTLTTPISDAIKSFSCSESRPTIYF